MDMIDDRGIAIAILQLEGPGQTVCGGVPSPMGGRQVPYMVQGRRKAYGAGCLLLSSTHLRVCSEGRERRGTNPLAIPGPEAELRGGEGSVIESGNWELARSYKTPFRNTVLISGLYAQLRFVDSMIYSIEYS